MASFAMEEFVGNGSLRPFLPKLLEEGWDDVPTLKIMNSEDMNDINMTRQQRDALEIRSYLHDRTMMQYADALETSGQCLSKLLSLSTAQLYTQFGMKRGHIARFKHQTMVCGTNPLPASCSIPTRRQITAASRSNSDKSDSSSIYSKKMQSITKFAGTSTATYDVTMEKSMSDLKINEGHFFKGIVAAMPAEPRACGCIQPSPVVDDVAPYSAIENIPVQKLSPEYKRGMQRLVKTNAPPMKASDLWRDKPAILLCIRRPGCIMCRADAHRIYSQKPVFDALGVQLFAVLHEHIDSEVNNYWPRYWGGAVLYDKGQGFFKALGGGKLMKDNYISGFILNPRVIANFKRAKAMGMNLSMKGQNDIKGGLFIIGSGKSGVAYQFIERNFGDWAPLSEITEICTRLQNQQPSQWESLL